MTFTPKKIIVLCTLLFLSSGILSSCGQKGALYIQQAEEQQAAQQHAKDKP